MRIGSVPYLNARPLVEGLPDVVFDVPSRLAKRFETGEVDVALVPAFESVRRPELPLVPGICVASSGPVDSVFLFARKPLPSVRRVLLDESSLTSAALTRILLRERFGARPEYERCSPDVDPREGNADAVLLIGDPALRAPREGMVVHDLAVLWREWTGLPFCFAIWLARSTAAMEEATPLLSRAKERGLARRGEIARKASIELQLPVPLLDRYLNERLRYDFGDAERKGLAHYAKLCRRLRLVDAPEDRPPR